MNPSFICIVCNRQFFSLLETALFWTWEIFALLMFIFETKVRFFILGLPGRRWKITFPFHFSSYLKAVGKFPLRIYYKLLWKHCHRHLTKRDNKNVIIFLDSKTMRKWRRTCIWNRFFFSTGLWWTSLGLEEYRELLSSSFFIKGP